jgi:hypothetical protein
MTDEPDVKTDVKVESFAAKWAKHRGVIATVMVIVGGLIGGNTDKLSLPVIKVEVTNFPAQNSPEVVDKPKTDGKIDNYPDDAVEPRKLRK